MSIDLSYARRQFAAYLRQYNPEDDKIRLKIIHTYGVVDSSRQICERLHLSEEDTALAQIIGLLHDIGRFEQIKRYDSFEPDTMDHAAYGVQILFEEGHIRDFVREMDWDPIIQTSIAMHSDYRLSDIPDSRTLLHARLIRDADKLDNCRVKLEDSIETMLGASAEEVGRSSITPEVMGQFRNRQSVLSSTRKTKMDYWLSYLAHYFDMNFKETLQIVREHRYAEKLIARIPYSNAETAAQMQDVKRILQEYFEEVLGKE